MGLFSFLRKKSQDEVIATVAEKILAGANSAKKVLSEDNERRAPYVGAEVAHLFLHLVDRHLYSNVSTTRRDAVYDKIAENVVAAYTVNVFQPGMPHMDPRVVASKMMDTLNSRQQTYGRCSSLMGDEFPTPGSMVFALSFFIHQVLGHTTRGNAGEILAGVKVIPEGEMDDFPGIESVLRTAIFVGSAYKELGIDADLKHLR